MALHFSKVPATFVHIPRTGGTSLEIWTKNNNIDVKTSFVPNNYINNSHNIVLPTLHALKLKWGNLGTTFAFVRNPYDWLASCYDYIGQQATSRMEYLKTSNLENWKTEPYQRDNPMLSIIDDTKLLKLHQKGFDYWLNILLESSEELYDQTNSSSWHIIDTFWSTKNQIDWFDGQSLDIIIKLEEIDNNFKKIQELFNCYETLPVTNTTVSTVTYNSDSKNIVRDIFSRDFKAFGYL